MGERRPERDRVLKRTDFLSRRENTRRIDRIRPEPAISGALQAEKRRRTRRFARSPQCRSILQTVWRRTESDANRSPRPNSLVTKENTGNCRIFRAVSTLWLSQKPATGLDFV
jgi:hypothetical protein